MQFYYVKVKAFLFCLNRKGGNDGGRSSVYVLLSLVNKETALAFLIGQPLGGWGKQNRIVGERKQRQADTMIPLPETDAGQTHACNPQPHDGLQIIRYGLIKMLELDNKRLKLMGQAVFKKNTVSV